jgi:hypothetical protein
MTEERLAALHLSRTRGHSNRFRSCRVKTTERGTTPTPEQMDALIAAGSDPAPFVPTYTTAGAVPATGTAQPGERVYFDANGDTYKGWLDRVGPVEFMDGVIEALDVGRDPMVQREEWVKLRTALSTAEQRAREAEAEKRFELNVDEQTLDDARLGAALRDAVRETDPNDGRWLYVSLEHACLRLGRGHLADTDATRALTEALTNDALRAALLRPAPTTTEETSEP